MKIQWNKRQKTSSHSEINDLFLCLKILSHDVRDSIIIFHVSVLNRMWKQNLQTF